MVVIDVILRRFKLLLIDLGGFGCVVCFWYVGGGVLVKYVLDGKI